MSKPPHPIMIRKWLKPGRPSWRRAGGFTMLELMAVLLALSALAFTLFLRTQSLSTQQLALDASHQLAVADAQLRQFAAEHGRLPCPDTGTSGVEDCSSGAVKGFLPYKTLGMATTQYVFGEIPLRYGVYRNATADADLALAKIRYNPTDSDGNSYATVTADALDLCTGLKNAAAEASSTSYTYLGWPDGSTANVAFSIAYPGNTDSDGVNGPYDGLNGAAGAGFNAPGTPLTAAYDDVTRSRGFNELYNMMRCDITQRSLDLAANAVDVEENDVLGMAASNAVTANQGVLMNAIGTAITAWGMVLGIAAVADASEVLAESSALLATAVATCIILVGCAFIPVYTVAVTAASIGLGGSIAAAVLSGVALGLQITATVLYVGIQGATGAPPTGTPSTPYVPTPATQSAINTAWNDYAAKKTSADAAQTAYAAGATAYSTAAATTAAAKTTLDNTIAATVVASPAFAGWGSTLYPLINGAGSLTVSHTNTVASTNNSTVTSTFNSGTQIWTPAVPVSTASQTTAVYSGNCITLGMTAAVALKTPGCTTDETYDLTQTTATTDYTTTPGTAITTVTTTVTHVDNKTTISANYVKGAVASIDQYEKLNAAYVVNGGTAPDATEMNNAINAADSKASSLQALYVLTATPCTGCAAAVANYLSDYQAQQLAYYKIAGLTGTPAAPSADSPLLINRDSTAAAAETALDNYNGLVCSTGSTLTGAGGGTTPGGSGTSYDSASNQCIAGSGAGTPGASISAASGTHNILDLLRSLGSVK